MPSREGGKWESSAGKGTPFPGGLSCGWGGGIRWPASQAEGHGFKAGFLL